MNIFRLSSKKLKLAYDKKLQFFNNPQLLYCQQQNYQMKLNNYSLINPNNDINLNKSNIIVDLKDLNFILSEQTNKLIIYLPKYTKINPKKQEKIIKTLIKLRNEFNNFDKIFILSYITKLEVESFFKNDLLKESKREINFLMLGNTPNHDAFNYFGTKELAIILNKENRIIYFTKKDLKWKLAKAILFGLLIYFNFVYIPFVESLI